MTVRNKVESEIGETGVGLPISTDYDNPVCSVDGCILPLKCNYLGTPFCHKHFHREYMRTHRPAPKDPRYFLGARGESAVRAILIRHGRHVEDQDSKCKYDFLVDGWRVEVKTVNPHSTKPGWYVNLQRNGILDEHTDFYIFRLESQFGPTHILMPGPVGKTGVYITRGPALSQRRADFETFVRGDLVPPQLPEELGVAGRFAFQGTA